MGGAFTTNGGVQVNGIARWDGANWHALGGGLTGGTFGSGALAIEYDGINVYAGGSFRQAGGLNATNVASWDGTAWHAMGSGLPGNVFCLARFGGLLYAGGTFTNASLGITNLASWNGSTWTPVNANGAVRDLLSTGTNLYVGGDFTSINGVAANRIAIWNGSAWSTMGAALQGFGVGAGPGVYKMNFDDAGRLLVVGNFNQVNGLGVSYAAGWDGTNWFALGGTTSHGMTHFLGQVQGLYSDGTNVYAGGTFTEGGDVVVNGVAQWNGTNWAALGSVVDGQTPRAVGRGFVSAGGFLYVGGNFTNIGGINAGYLAQWDGNNWADFGDADSSVRALAWDGAFVWAGGIFTNVAGIYSPGLAVYWPGAGWFNYGTLGGAGGGQAWVNAIAWDGANLYFGGNFVSAGGVSATNIAYFNNSTGFSALGNGVNNTVGSIVVTNGMVYVSGGFTSASGVPANGVAAWNGSGWSALGAGLTGVAGSGSTFVNALAFIGTNLYAGGNFTNAGGVPAAGVARWNGTSWSALGSGLYFGVFNQSGTALALAAQGNDLFVGGSITAAGSKPASFIGHWNDQMNYYPPPHPMLSRPTWPGGGKFQFRYSGTSGQSYILQGSTNLSSWVPLTTNTSPIYDFTDTNAQSFPRRFYRAVLGP